MNLVTTMRKILPEQIKKCIWVWFMHNWRGLRLISVGLTYTWCWCWFLLISVDSGWLRFSGSWFRRFSVWFRYTWFWFRLIPVDCGWFRWIPVDSGFQADPEEKANHIVRQTFCKPYRRMSYVQHTLFWLKVTLIVNRTSIYVIVNIDMTLQ